VHARERAHGIPGRAQPRASPKSRPSPDPRGCAIAVSMTGSRASRSPRNWGARA
jgi:hypothetical protein